MSSSKLTAFRINLGPNYGLERVKKVVQEWQRLRQSQARLYLSETTALLCGEVETWVVIEGYTVDSRNIFASVGVTLGILDLYDALHKALDFDRDVVRPIVFPAQLGVDQEE